MYDVFSAMGLHTHCKRQLSCFVFCQQSTDIQNTNTNTSTQLKKHRSEYIYIYISLSSLLKQILAGETQFSIVGLKGYEWRLYSRRYMVRIRNKHVDFLLNKELLNPYLINQITFI